MSILKNIESHFQEIGFHVRQVGDKLIGNFTIGDASSSMKVSVIGSGDSAILNFEVIGLLKPDEVRQSQHVAAFLQYLLAQNWQFSAGALEMDSDGEVRVLVEFPLADGSITVNQLRLIIQILGQNAVELLKKGRKVLATGSAGADEEEANVPDDAELTNADYAAMLARFTKVAETAEGRALLLEMKARQSCPPMIATLIDVALQMAMPDEL